MFVLEKDYENIHPLGKKGGMGELYCARKRSLGVDVVIKKIKKQYKGRVDQENEANILKKLKHQYLPRIYDLITDDEGYVYTIMDLIPGQTLNEFVKKNGPVSQKLAYKWACQLCEVILYLHRQTPPIIHCDIKPSNIMITPAGNICLIDFNTSLVFYDGALAIGTTAGYAAPEQYIKPEQRNEYLRSVLRQKNMEGGASYDNGQTEIMSERSGYNSAYPAYDETEIMGRNDETELAETGYVNDNDEYTILMDEGNKTEVMPEMLRRDRAYETQGCYTGSYDNSISRSFTAAETIRAGGYGTISVRTDIYAVGATLYFAVTSHVPEKSTGEVTDISEYKPSVSVLFQNIIRRAMEKMPSERFADADEMLRALNDIDVLDVRYQKYRRLKKLYIAGLIASFIAGCICTFYGYSVICKERNNLYLGIIAQSEKYADTGDYDNSSKSIDEAVSMMPSRPEAYMSKASELYRTGQYQKALDVFNDAENAGTLKLERIDEASASNIAYIKGNCYSALEDYDSAVKMYKSALSYTDANAACYRQLAIAQAQSGNISAARTTLAELKGKGLSDADTTLIEAEINAASDDIDSAIESYRQVIEKTDDNEILRHCYIALAKQYEKANDAVSEISLLEEASDRLEGPDRVQIMSMLAEKYADEGEKKNSVQYFIKAKELFESIIQEGYGTITTYLNLTSMEQKTGDYSGAEKELKNLLNDYPYDYRVDMRLAFLYADWQSHKDIAERDYSDVAAYYESAADKYKQAKANGREDADMKILENLVAQIRQAGWL